VSLRFQKMHGAGNDFMLLDLRSATQRVAAPPLEAERIRAWGDRNTGIGFDQLLVLEPHEDPAIEARVRIWNADGSSAEQCGNGMRAIGLYLSDIHAGEQRCFRLATPTALITATHVAGEQVRVEMGHADFSARNVPYTGPQADADRSYSLSILNQILRFGVLSMGNPHAVLEVEDVKQAPVRAQGEALRSSELFPQSCNVGFAEVVSRDQIRLRVLERGAGETRACGSGACAAVAWLAFLGRVGNKVRVEQAGGTLEVETDRGAGPITLTGPATHVFEGMIE